MIEFGCNFIIVSHLEDGSLWNRSHFPNTTLIEVRPQSNISRESGLFGGAKDVLGFNAGNINSWIDQGYWDTTHCVGSVINSLKSRRKLEQSKEALFESESRNEYADNALNNAMDLLK